MHHSKKPRKNCRSYKKFDDNEFIKDISNIPFRVGEIFETILMIYRGSQAAC